MAQYESTSSALQQPNSNYRFIEIDQEQEKSHNESPHSDYLVAQRPSSLPSPTRSQGPETDNRQPDNPTTMPSLSMNTGNSGFEERMTDLEISFTITTAMGYLSAQQLDKAISEIRKAEKIATTKGFKIHALRCRYWSGRIEFELANFASAHKHFRAALPCLIYDEYPEGADLMLYLRLSQPEVSEAVRQRILRQQRRSVFRERPDSARRRQNATKHSRLQTPSDEVMDYGLHPPKKRPPNCVKEPHRKYDGTGRNEKAESVADDLGGLSLEGTIKARSSNP